MKNENKKPSLGLANAWNQVVPDLLKSSKKEDRTYLLFKEILDIHTCNPNRDFQKDIQVIRKRFHIPKLDHHRDNAVELSEYPNAPSESLWVSEECLNPLKFLKTIDKLIHKYSLPANSDDLIEKYVLYEGYLPPAAAFSLYSYLPYFFLENPEKYKKIGLTKAEKTLILENFEWKLKSDEDIDEKSDMEIQACLDQLKRFLSKIKDKPLVSAVTQQAIRDERKLGKKEKYYETTTDSDEILTITSSVLAERNIKKRVNKKVKKQEASKIRVRVKRLKDRRKSLTKRVKI